MMSGGDKDEDQEFQSLVSEVASMPIEAVYEELHDTGVLPSTEDPETRT